MFATYIDYFIVNTVLKTLLRIIVQLLTSPPSQRLPPNRAKASQWSSHKSQVRPRTSCAPRPARAPSYQRRLCLALQGRCPACSLTLTTPWASCPSTAVAVASLHPRSKQRQVFFLLCPHSKKPENPPVVTRNSSFMRTHCRPFSRPQATWSPRWVKKRDQDVAHIQTSVQNCVCECSTFFSFFTWIL